VPIIINGGSRRDGDWWSKHLGNEEDNEQAQVIEYRGLTATSMRDAFYEMEALSAGTNCDNYFYQANINPRPDEVLTPQQWREAVDTLERNLGLTDCPRFVVRHEKDGRVHQHVVWSRIDAERGVAISDSLTARIHEQTSRELEIKFDLQRGTSILVPNRDFERPERGPKKWETFRGAKSGIDPKEMKAELEAIRQRCDSGASFRAALEESGAYVLARGDSRDYVIIDRVGDVHSLARRVGINTNPLRKYMADLDLSTVPTVEQAKSIQNERQAQGQYWDRDADNRDWESQVQNAAIAAAKETPHPKPGAAASKAIEHDAPAARGVYAELKPAPAPAPETKKDHRNTRTDIREALAASQDADPVVASAKLQAALKERGIGLAAVTVEESEASHRTATYARAIGGFAPKFAAGEIVAVDSRGHAYRMDERVTRQPGEVIAERLAGIDRDQLASVKETKDAVREASRAQWRAEKDEERAKTRINEPVSGALAELRMAFAMAPGGPHEEALQEALAARGMTLARATGKEANASQEHAKRYADRKRELDQLAEATAAGRYAELKPQALRYSPRLNEGEIVAVDQRGHVYKLDERSTGLRKADIEGRLSGLEGLCNVTDAQAAMREAALESWKAEQADRREQVREPSWIERRIIECARRGDLGALIQIDADGNQVRGAEALADRLRPADERRTKGLAVRGARAFAAELEDAGIALVRVTETDMKALDALRQDEVLAQLAAETDRVAYKGYRFDACVPGDLAAVTRRGDVYRINPHKLDGVARYLDAALPGVVEARSQFEIDREQTDDVWLQLRLDIGNHRTERELVQQERAEVRAGSRAINTAAETIEEGLEGGDRIIQKAVGGIVRLLEGLADFLFPQPRLTRDQAERAGHAAEEEEVQARVAADGARERRETVDAILERDRRRRDEERAILFDLPEAPRDQRRSREDRERNRSLEDRERDRY
jgi:hypothetical protein